MKRWWLVIALMLSLGVNAGILASRLVPPKAEPEAAAASAGEPADATPQRSIPARVFRLADELGLEGARREEFVDLQRRFFSATLEARARLRRSQLRLRQELTAPAPDRRAVDEALEEMAAARGDLERAFVDNLLASRELLDSQQTRRYLRFLGRLRLLREELERRGLRRPGLRP